MPDYPAILNRVKYPKEEWLKIEPPPVQQANRANRPPDTIPRRHPLGIGAWNDQLKQPKQWQRLLFEGILHQPLGGGKFKYDSESLEALSIIED